MVSAKFAVLDVYEWKARYLPSIIALTPPILSSWSLYPELHDLPSTFATMGVAAPLIYFLANLARIAGKRIEPKLYHRWGGMPTTRLLRHSDGEIDPMTKSRYKGALQATISNIKFPTPDEEIANPTNADHVYESASNWLRSQTRDKSLYPRVFQELVNYGFIRNLYGLKPLALILSGISLIVLITTLFCSFGFSEQNVTLQCSQSSVSMPEWTAIGVSALLVIGLTFFITQKSAERIAISYAKALLESCENLP